MNRYGSCTILATGAALALSGWAKSTRDLYEGEQTQADVLPGDVAVEGENWNANTSWLLASHGGHEFYAGASTTEGDCLLTYDPQMPENWVVSCGTARHDGSNGVKTKFDPEGLPEKTAAGWTRLTPEPEVTDTRSNPLITLIINQKNSK